jgi:hypothetical protein
MANQEELMARIYSVLSNFFGLYKPKKDYCRFTNVEVSQLAKQRIRSPSSSLIRSLSEGWIFRYRITQYSSAIYVPQSASPSMPKSESIPPTVGQPSSLTMRKSQSQCLSGQRLVMTS